MKRPHFVSTPIFVSAPVADKKVTTTTQNGLAIHTTLAAPSLLERERVALVKQLQQRGGLSA
ncbi:hypothetical protein [Vibrio sp. 10N]|uniref:hypothetical protein n=1 Tax=Vibrio sp. 10N TaxID=3058938 RepID=UPI0028135DEB|nr:hypothetical protein VB10N_38750 [Vibrio sp. 10N]